MKKLNALIRVMLSIGFILMMVPSAYSQDSAGDDDLKNNPQLKEEVFSQILTDRDLFSDFMHAMMQNQESMEWMMDQHQMMQHMYSADHMQKMTEKNPDMRKPMMQGWMKMMKQDTAVYNQMQHMMQQQHMESGHMH